MQNIAIMLVFYIIHFLLKCISNKQKFYQKLALLAFKSMKKRVAIARVNIDYIYGDTLSATQKEGIIKRCFVNHIYVLLFFVEYKNKPLAKCLAAINFKNTQALTNAIKQNKKIILTTYHYGLWELLFLLSHLCGERPVTVTTQIYKQPFLQYLISSVREQYGLQTMSAKNTFSQVYSALKTGKIVMILTDQATKENNAKTIDFLGKPTFTNYAPALLAKKQNAVIIPFISTANSDFTQLGLEFGEPISPTQTLDKEQDIRKMTKQQSQFLEQHIKQDAGLWLWIHRRFKYEKPTLYENI